MFEHGLLNLTNWAANVIMPALAGLMFAAAVYRFGKAQPYAHLSWAGFASLMCSGLLRLLESFAQQAAAKDPDRCWIALLGLVNWTSNVMLPLYGTIQVVMTVLHLGGVLERMSIGDAWARNALTALMCFALSGLLRLAEFWIQNGTAGVR
jgi:p-aminobenzoyl-glutamate transporter AbgT